MLPGGTDPGYRALLAGPHRSYTRVEVWAEGVRIDSFGTEGAPVYGGAVIATLASQITRTLNMQTDEVYYPADPSDLFAPWGNELRVFQGIKPGAGVPYEFQTFRGKIQEVNLQADGSISISANDRAQEAADNSFIVPENSNTANGVEQEFRRLVLAGVPDATFSGSDIALNAVPVLTWESSRGGACDDLATASNAYWYALANGDFTIRTWPWTIAQTPLVEWMDGDGGILSTAIPSVSRRSVYNQIVVTGERADGTTPVYAFYTDIDVASPTYYQGKFGQKTLLVQAQGAVNQAQALSMARSILRSTTALTQSWSVTLTADPSLELGDCVAITARGLPRDTQVVSSFSLPLVETGPMNATTRALKPGSGEEL